jgi:hypothetical protein
MIVERQRLRVLHAADPAEVARAYGEYTAGAERIGVTGARLRNGSGTTDQPKNKKHNTAH